MRRAHNAGACKEQYGRAYKAETMAELCRVIKDNWDWCCGSYVVTPDLLEKYREEFAEQQIYVNVDTDNGFLLALGTATVEAWGNATVRAWGNATVRAWDNAYCTSYRMIKCKLSGHALHKVRSTNTVYFASDDIKFVKQELIQQES